MSFFRARDDYAYVTHMNVLVDRDLYLADTNDVGC